MNKKYYIKLGPYTSCYGKLQLSEIDLLKLNVEGIEIRDPKSWGKCILIILYASNKITELKSEVIN